MKKRDIKRSLLTLIVVSLFGFASVLATHRIFLDIETKLDKVLHNTEVRNKIGKFILADLSTIESLFYKIALSKNNALSQVLKKEIKYHIEMVKKSLSVLESGGSVTYENTLNVANVEKFNITHTYFPKGDKYNISLESIDLLPKLNDLEDKVDELILLISEYERTDLTGEEAKEVEYKINLFIKMIPTSFIRMKENANRLMYQSRLEAEKHREDIYKQKNNYNTYEGVISMSVVLLIFILWLKVSNQIKQTNKDLMKSSSEQKRLAKEAEEANKAKTVFLANMSHEIRTPLNSIIGFSEILSHSELPKEEKGYAGVVTRNAKALLGIINDILDISKIESGNIELSSEQFEPATVFDQTVELLNVKAQDKNIRFNYEYDTNIPKGLYGDYFRIQQVLANFISNAIKFTPDSGVITFSIKLNHADEEKCSLAFSVKDSGIGVSQDALEKIFEPFSQANDSITRLYGGTGLGLAICQKLIQLMGSEIKVESIVNVGSQFSFNLEFTISDERSFEEKSVRTNFSFAVFKQSDNPDINRISDYISNFGSVDINPCASNENKYDMVFCMPENNYGLLEDVTSACKESPLVFVGNTESVDSDLAAKFKYSIDAPIYGSKILSIVSSECVVYQNEDTDIFHDEKYSGTVLVAEDNPSNQMLIKLLLSKLGLTTEIAHNGQEAFDKCIKGNYCVVFMDVNMPVMDGITASKEIIDTRKELNLPELTIIALTANALKGDKERYLEAGMCDYLSKPILSKDLINIISRYCTAVKQDKTLIDIAVTEPEIQEEIGCSFDKHKSARNLDLDDSTYEMLAENFYLTLESNLKKLEGNITDKKPKETIEITHYIKGACSNLGMQDPTTILEQIESDAEKGIFDDTKLSLIRLYFKMIKDQIFDR